MKIKTTTIYSDENGNTLVFSKVAKVPGFTHRVVINGSSVSWLSDTHKPNAKSAKFFLEQYAKGEI